MSNIFTPVLHPRIAAREKERPVKVADQLPKSGPMQRFNCALALKITDGVGTMWCAYAFTLIALISLPSVLKTGSVVGIVAWVAQTFLQLVLLSIIIVGQNIMAAASDKRSEATYEDADAVLHTALQIQAHLAAQDDVLERLVAQLQAMKSGGSPAPA
jgi:hypothetical protein